MASIRGINTVVHIHAIVMAPALNLISWNVRGMGDASKRYAIFASLKHFFPAIVFLSETHFLKEKLHLLQKPWVGHAFHSVYSSHVRGVSILIHRQIPFRCCKSLIDPEGHFICLDCFIHNVPIILVAVCGLGRNGLQILGPFRTSNGILSLNSHPHFPRLRLRDSLSCFYSIGPTNPHQCYLKLGPGLIRTVPDVT